MPRTFKATIALIVTLIALALLTIFNVVQTNSAQEDVIQLRKKLDSLTETNSEILQQLKRGVTVSGQAGNSNAGDMYAKALNDPDNILSAPSQPLFPPDAKQGGTLRRHMGNTPKGFNWLTENGADVQELATYAHNGFAKRDLTNPDKWVGDLAYKITESPDHKVYTIYLRHGVYWQVPNVDLSDPKHKWLKDPHELTAKDAVFYFDMIKNPQVQAGAVKSYFKDMDHAEVVDKYTFKVIWKKKVQQSEEATIGGIPLPSWLYTKNEDGSPIPKATLGTQFNNHWASRYPVGTGPYKITDIEKDKQIVLTRNEDYFGKKPPIKKIVYQIIKDPNTAYRELQGNQLDMTTLPPPKYKSDILDAGPDSPFKTGKLKYKIVTEPAYYYLGWNMDKPMFSDKRVRQAMTHALNRDSIIKNVLQGLGRKSTGPFLPGQSVNNPNVKPYKFDLDQARKLLAAAGWKDSNGDGVLDKMIDGQRKDFKFTMLAYDKPTTRSWLAVYKEDLRKIGVIMTPSFVDWSLMQKKMDQREFDGFTGGWGLGWSHDPYQLWHSSQADVPKGSNRVGFRNKRADEIIEKLRVTFDKQERTKLLREFHMILHEEQPYTFFYQPKAVIAWQPKLQHVVFQQIRPISLSLPWWIKQ